MPGLILKLNSEPKNKPTLPELKNLSVSFRVNSGQWSFVLALKEINHIELFEILCRDIVSYSEQSESINEALHKANLRARRWHYLLRVGHSDRLSLEEQQGLVCELAFLRALVEHLGPELAIDSWKGPLGSSKDFEFTGCCIEVKSRKVAGKNVILISSEDQLSDMEGGQVFLSVFSVESAIGIDGMTIHDHVATTQKLFESSIGSLLKWESLILSTGYDVDKEYENRCWNIRSHRSFEVSEHFPRLCPPLPNGVHRLKYSIDLEACSDFEIKENIYKIIKEHYKK